MAEQALKCKAEIRRFEGRMVFRHPCRNRAVTPSGYCRVHDRDCAREREAKRMPSKYERYTEARHAVDEAVAALPAEDRDRLRALIAAERSLT